MSHTWEAELTTDITVGDCYRLKTILEKYQDLFIGVSHR